MACFWQDFVNTYSPDCDVSPIISLLHLDVEDFVLNGGVPIDEVSATWTQGSGSATGGIISPAGRAMTDDGATGWIRTSNLPEPLGTGDFTIAGWYNTTDQSAGGQNVILDIGGAGGLVLISGTSDWIGRHGAYIEGAGPFYFTNSGNPHFNVNIMYALVRHNGVLTFYYNGVAQPNTFANTTNFTSIAATYFAFANNSSNFGGTWDELIITKEALYTSNFTPPTSPFTYP